MIARYMSWCAAGLSEWEFGKGSHELLLESIN